MNSFLRLGLIVGTIVAVVCSVSFVSAQTTFPIYEDSVLAPWSPNSFRGFYDYTNTTRVFRGSAAIFASSSSWEGVSFYTQGVPQPTVGHAYLEFSAYSSSSFRIYPILKLGTRMIRSSVNPVLPANQWTTFSIPLSKFIGLASGTIDRVDIMNDGSPRLWYVDAVGFTASASGATTTVAEKILPTVTLSGITQGSSVSGAVPLAVSATDNVGISQIQIKVDGALKGSTSLAPASYSYLWDVTKLTNGPHTVQATAIDGWGNSVSSLPITVLVNNPVSPRPNAQPISIYTDSVVIPWMTSSSRGTFDFQSTVRVYRGSASILANTLSGGKIMFSALAPVSVAQHRYLEFAVFSTGTQRIYPLIRVAGKLSTLTSVTTLANQWKLFSIPLPIGMATSGASIDYLELRSDTYSREWSIDEIKLVSTSSIIDIDSPVVSLLSPLSGATVSGTAVFSASASDNVGVKGITFKVDGVRVGSEDLTAPYSVTWNTANVVKGTHSVWAEARDVAGNKSVTQVAVIAVTTPPDLSVPTTPSGLFARAISPTQIDLSWYAARDNVGVAGYRVYRNGTVSGMTTSTRYSDTGLVASTSYSYQISAYDSAGNESIKSATIVGRTFGTVSTSTTGDRISPSVSISIPLNDSSVSGTIVIRAVASDNVGVSGVQFQLDGINLMAEDLSSPYEISWDTLTTTNGAHQLKAVARDAAGNRTVSLMRTVSVLNSDNGGGEIITTSTSGLWVSAYLNSWDLNVPNTTANNGPLTVDKIDWSAFTHMILFATGFKADGTCCVEDQNGDGNLGNDNWQASRFNALTTAGHARGKPVLFSVGGAGNTAFATMLNAGPTVRTTAVNNLITFLNKYKFDGIDLDPEAGSAQCTNLPSFVTELRTRLNQQQAYYDASKKPILTAAILNCYPEWSSVADQIDQINVMSYDLTGTWWGETWHNNAAKNIPGTRVDDWTSCDTADWSEQNGECMNTIEKKIKLLIKNGIQKAKIGGGVDFNGFLWTGGTNVNGGYPITPRDRWSSVPSNKGLNSSCNFSGSGETIFSLIKKCYLDLYPGFIQWDPISQVSYFGRNDIYITYQDVRSVRNAVKAIKEAGVGGMILWELGGAYLDTTLFPSSQYPNLVRDELLQAVKSEVYGGGSGVVAPTSTPDLVSPSIPSGLSAIPVSASQINLSWSVSTDNVGVTGYRVYRGGTQIGTVSGTSYQNTGLSQSTSYTYTVTAYDAAGNTSSQSIAVTATTQAVVMPAPTSTPTSTKFSAGNRVQVTANLNVRGTPSASGTLLGTQSAGALGTILNGPTIANGYTWWNVNYDSGVDGWSAENWLTMTTTTVIAPPTATSTMMSLGYYTLWSVCDMPPVNIDYDALTHIVHFNTSPRETYPYTTISDASSTSALEYGVPGWCDSRTRGVPEGWQQQMINLGHAKGVKTLLSMGGEWGDNAVRMDKIVSNTLASNSMHVFVDTVLDYAKRRNYDGVEVNWEFPGGSSDKWDNVYYQNGMVLDGTVSTQLSVGARIKTNRVLDVRAAAFSTSTRYGTSTVGALGTIMGGPVSVGQYLWWNVNYDSGVDGWSTQTYTNWERAYVHQATQQHISDFLNYLRQGIDSRWGAGNGLLAVTVGNYTNNLYDMTVLNRVADILPVMNYGMGAASYSGFNAPIYKPTAYPNYNADYITKSTSFANVGWANLGIDKKKILLLMSFENIKWSGNNSSTTITGPGQPNGRAGSWSSYSSALQERVNNPSNYHWDDVAKASWIGGGAAFQTFEDTKSIQEKVKYAQSIGIGGIGAYDLWRGWLPTSLNDPDQMGKRDPLLQALKQALGR